MRALVLLWSIIFMSISVNGQKLSTSWEELTAPDFALAVQQSDGVCIIPMGVLEKHGPHLPLGTDVYIAREVSLRAAEKEYCIVFPYYFVGQIFEAKQQPGTVAYSAELLYKFLEETCQEISRNGIKKIILANMHGGNNHFLKYFCQAQLAEPKDYAVYLFTPSIDAETQQKIAGMRKSTIGGHADEVETGMLMAIHPNLVRLDQATNQSGNDLNRLQLENAFTGINWYASYPNHYAGDAKDANEVLGNVALKPYIEQLSNVIKTVKADQNTLNLQDNFFKESSSPLKTPIQ